MAGVVGDRGEEHEELPILHGHDLLGLFVFYEALRFLEEYTAHLLVKSAVGLDRLTREIENCEIVEKVRFPFLPYELGELLVAFQHIFVPDGRCQHVPHSW